MLTECSLIGFIPTVDADRARRFYVDVLRMKFESDDGFAVVVSGAGYTIRLVRMREFVPASYTILGWEVPDIAATAQDLARDGISWMRVPPLPQDDLGIWTTPSGSMVAWFHDPDGNVLSISQH